MENVTYVVEKNVRVDEGGILFLHVDEFKTTAAMAEALKQSPAKTRNAVSQMRKGRWNMMNDYRVYLKETE